MYRLATASRKAKNGEYMGGTIIEESLPLTPVVGAYSSESVDMVKLVGLGGASGISPTSGAPWPRFAHECESYKRL